MADAVLRHAAPMAAWPAAAGAQALVMVGERYGSRRKEERARHGTNGERSRLAAWRSTAEGWLVGSGSAVQRFDVVVVGGGAAGLMCAIEAGRRGRSVVV